jgi:hypothetical protein
MLESVAGCHVMVTWLLALAADLVWGGTGLCRSEGVMQYSITQTHWLVACIWAQRQAHSMQPCSCCCSSHAHMQAPCHLTPHPASFPPPPDLVNLGKPGLQHIARYLPSVRRSSAAFSFVVNLVVPGTPQLNLVITMTTDRHPNSLGVPPEDGAGWRPFDLLMYRCVLAVLLRWPAGRWSASSSGAAAASTTACWVHRVPVHRHKLHRLMLATPPPASR